MIIRGETAIITGSTGPIGQAVCTMLAQAGCSVYCHYHHNESAANELAERCRQIGVKAASFCADLTAEDEAEALFVIAAAFSKPSILVNCVGIFERRPIADVNAETFGRIMNTNVLSVLLSCRAFVKHLGKHSDGKSGQLSGRIINIADVGGIRPWAGYTEYCASKAALISITKSLARELAPGFIVNAVAPGIVTIPEDFDQAAIDRQIKMIPAGRIGTPQEVAAAVRLLLENDYITGQVLNVDGGRVI